MEDVARFAGVNKATVSRALKGDPRISSATRDKVWNAAKVLGYRLDRTASVLSGGRTGLAAVVLENLKPWFSPLFFCGLNRVLGKAGMEILLKLPGFNNDVLEASLISRRVDCILLAGNGEGIAPARFLLSKIPVVTAGFSIAETPSVLVSEQETLSRLRSVSSGRPLCLVSGTSPLFPFLSRSIANSETAREECFWIMDDWAPEDVGCRVRFGCVCALPEEPVRSGFFRLEWPAFEMGVAVGRLLIKTLSGKDVFPTHLLPVPLLRDTMGEKLLFEKMN